MGAENRIYMRVMQLNVTKTNPNEISNGLSGEGTPVLNPPLTIEIQLEAIINKKKAVNLVPLF